MEVTEERESAERGGRDALGKISSPPAGDGVIKTNNSREPPNQQNANLTLRQKDRTERQEAIS